MYTFMIPFLRLETGGSFIIIVVTQGGSVVIIVLTDDNGYCIIARPQSIVVINFVGVANCTFWQKYLSRVKRMLALKLHFL